MAMKKSDYKSRQRAEAQRIVVRKSNMGTNEHLQAVEQGRRHLLQKSSEGGDTMAQKVKSEILYLLNNYTPTNDARIEGLIDKWRISGDPSYDPAIKIKLRNARRDYMKSNNPF